VRKRVITTAVGVAGLVVVGLGVASATAWRADDVLVASTTASSHVVVTDPGVLELGGDPATVRVTAADGAEVVVVVGRDTDVDGWVGDDDYTRVTGLASWRELATVPGEPGPSSSTSAPSPDASSSPDGSPDASPAPTDAASADPTTAPADDAASAPTQASPAGNDNWVAQAIGEDGTAELVWPAQGGRWSLLAVSRGAAEPTLEISWPRVVTTPWLWPCVVAGSLLVLVAGGLLLREWQGGRPGTWEAVHSGAVPVVDTSRPLTRRQLREAAQAASGRTPTGSVARVTGPQATVELPPEGRHSSPDAARPVGRVVARTPADDATPTVGLDTVAGSPSGARSPSPVPSADRAGLAPVGAPGTPAGVRGPEASAPSGAPAASVPASRPLSRRALRAEGATAAVPTAPEQQPAAAQPGHAQPRQAPPGLTQPAATLPPVGRPADATRSVTSGPGAPTGPHQVQPAAPWAGAAGPTRPAPGPRTVADAAGAPGPADARPAAPGSVPLTPSTGAPDDPSAVDGPHVPSWGRPTPSAPGGTGHARPSWLAGRPTDAPVRPTGSSASPASPALPSPGGWVPARTDDASGTTSAARPAWTAGGPAARGAAPVTHARTHAEPRTQDPARPGDAGPGPASEAAASRADAWRRAWGLPPSTEGAGEGPDASVRPNPGEEER